MDDNAGGTLCCARISRARRKALDDNRQQSANSSTTLLSANLGCRVHEVPHAHQLHNWDCGLACVLMVLRWCGAQHVDMAALRRQCTTTSVWTVDLAHLLHYFGVQVEYNTLTLGANPAFSNEAFYKASIEEDGLRVAQLFAKAAAAGICIRQRSLSHADIAQFVCSGPNVVIALVDKRRLSVWRFAAAADACLGACCGMQLSSYTGHYIVICGYDGATDEFFVQDPASHAQYIRVKSDALDDARRAFGTDEDLLLVGSSSCAVPHRPAQRSMDSSAAAYSLHCYLPPTPLCQTVIS